MQWILSKEATFSCVKWRYEVSKRNSEYNGQPCKIDPYTLKGNNISHLGKRKIIFKGVLGWDMLVPRTVL